MVLGKAVHELPRGMKPDDHFIVNRPQPLTSTRPVIVSGILNCHPIHLPAHPALTGWSKYPADPRSSLTPGKQPYQSSGVNPGRRTVGVS